MNLSLFTADFRLLLKSRWWYLFVGFSASVPLIASFSDDFSLYLLYVYSVGPLFFLPAISTTIAMDRHRGTIRNFFTTPMSKIDYILAKFLQWFTLGSIYILITLPLSLAYCHISGSFIVLLTSILYSLLTFFFLASLGIFISLLVKGIALFPMALSSLLSVLFYLAYLVYPQAIGYSAGLALLRASPLVPMGDALSIWSYSSTPFMIYHMECSSLVLSLASMLTLSAFLLISSFLIFCRAQNIFGYAERRRVYLTAALLIIPFLIPASDYVVGMREFIRGSSLSFEISVEPEAIVYDGSAIETTLKIFIPHGMSGLRNVTLALYSPDLSFVPSNFSFEYPNLKSEGERAFFEVPVRMGIENTSGFIYGTYEIDATMVSRERSDFLSTRVRIENRRAELLASLCFILSVISPSIATRRFSYE